MKRINRFGFLVSVFIAWFITTAAMCEGDSSSTHGAGDGSTTYGDINVDDGGTLNIESHTTPAAATSEGGAEDEDGLIYGCSVESEAEGRCSRSPD